PGPDCRRGSAEREARASGRASAGGARRVSLHREGKVTLGAVTVSGDDAPEHAIAASRQRRQANLQERAVGGADPRVPFVHPVLLGAPDATRADHGLDATLARAADAR